MTASAAQKHLFYLELAKLLQAGFDIRRAAAVMMDTHLPAPQVALLQKVVRGLESGQSITAAFAEDRESISALERSIIGAGERGGNLGVAFQHLADYHSMLDGAKRAVIKGLIYPVIVLHMGVFIATVPMALMQGGQSLGKILAGFLFTLLTVYPAAFVIWIATRSILRATPENAGLDRLVNRLPWIGKARANLAMARFCKVYHSCLLAGISMDETNQLSADASRSGIIREAGTRLVTAAKAGESLGPRFIREDAFPKGFARSYATGEEAGTLDVDLARWAKWFQEEAEASVRQAALMVPKMMYFAVIAFVAWKILGFFNAYYGMLDQMGGEN